MSRLDDLARLCEEATAGPWTAGEALHGNQFHVAISVSGAGMIAKTYRREEHVSTAGTRPISYQEMRANAALIAAARTYLPRLIEVARAAKDEHVDCEAMRQAGRAAHPCEVCDLLAALEAL